MSRTTHLPINIFSEDTLKVMEADLKNQVVNGQEIDDIEQAMKHLKTVKGELATRREDK